MGKRKRSGLDTGTAASTSCVLMSLLLLAATVQDAHANGFDLYGVGSRNAGMGSASVSTAEGYSAIYYNPAGMNLNTSTAGMGIFVTFDNVGISLAPRPNGYDLPDLGSNSPVVGSAYRLRPRQDTAGVESLVGLYLGGTTTLGFEDLRVGAVAMIPLNQVGTQQSWFNDEREQYVTNALHFDLLDTRVHHQIVLFGASYRILDWVTIGAALSFHPGVDSLNAVYIDNFTDQSEIDLNVNIRQTARWRPTAGMLFLPDGPLRVGLTFRDEQFMALLTRNEIQVRGFQGTSDYPFFQDVSLVLQYSPRQLVGGASWSNEDMLLSGELTWYQWSRYSEHHDADAGFNDTLTVRVGGEVVLSDHDDLRLGMGFEPTPVPEQSGRTNFVDNTRLIASAGMGHVIDIAGSSLRIGWHVQFHYLLPRTEVKTALNSYPDCGEGVMTLCDELPDDTEDPASGRVYPEAAGLQTGNPGFPGYSSGGWIGSGGVEISWEY